MKKRKVLIEEPSQYLDDIMRQIIDSYYPDLKNIKIKPEITKGKGFFMQTTILPKFIWFFTGWKIEVHKSVLKMPLPELTACMAHELEHIYTQVAKAKNWFHIPKQNEREIDRWVIERGLGNELLLLAVYHDKRYKKYTKDDGLTVKEIRQILQHK